MGKQVEGCQAALVAHRICKALNHFGVRSVFLLRHTRHGEVVLDEPDHEFGVLGRQFVLGAELPRIGHAKRRMVAAASLCDVVKEGGDIEQPVALEADDEPGHQRVFVRMFAHREAPHVAQHHEDVLIDRVDMEQVVLHLSDDTAPRDNVARQDAVFVHAPEAAHDAALLLQDLQEQGAMLGACPEGGIHTVAIDPQGAQRARSHALEFGALLQQQEALEQRGGFALEHILMADVEQFAHDLEAGVDRDRRAAVGKDHAAVVLQQYSVELHDHLRGHVVALHQNFGCASGRRGFDAEDARELFLVVEQQPILAAPGQQVQTDAQVLEETLDIA